LKCYHTMKNTNLIYLLAFVLLLFVSPVPVHAQDAENVGPQTLKRQFQEMLDKSETYTEYKVIKRSRLSQYSKAVQDSINANRNEIRSLKSKVAEQQNQISTLSKKIEELEEELAKSEELRESLLFLGISLNKATYHVIVWLIIAGLVVFGGMAYTSFIRSNKITSKTKKEYKALEVEYEEHKKKSHEKQIKMGRELQTERNRVEELKTKIKAKSQSNS